MTNGPYSFEEKSIFHTRELRDTTTNVHLLLVLFCFISSLGVAIWFAESKNSNFPVAAQAMRMDESR